MLKHRLRTLILFRPGSGQAFRTMISVKQYLSALQQTQMELQVIIRGNMSLHITQRQDLGLLRQELPPHNCPLCKVSLSEPLLFVLNTINNESFCHRLLQPTNQFDHREQQAFDNLSLWSAGAPRCEMGGFVLQHLIHINKPLINGLQSRSPFK